ncbi:hypothetical protein [Mycolicibacterium sp. J2]|uniref:hypothetical protein n=1 Tax=Mycolicibacterium sp. J2 TaxID=2993511 RepID=UPI002B056CCF|nr:hypothetical protein [Mycolicibacterium sp. J2]
MPNPEMIALGPKREKAGRDNLNALGLIESDRSTGRFVHELTDRGWRLCRDILTPGAPRAPPERPRRCTPSWRPSTAI